jgi:lantibiotic modifying enzyme
MSNKKSKSDDDEMAHLKRQIRQLRMQIGKLEMMSIHAEKVSSSRDKSKFDAVVGSLRSILFDSEKRLEELKTRL